LSSIGYSVLFSVSLHDALPIFVVYVLLSNKGQWRWTLWDGFPLLAAIYAAMYLIGPSEVAGVSYLQERLNFFPFLAIILWLAPRDRKSTRLNSSHQIISYAGCV